MPDTCHIDVGYSRQIAHVLGVQPTTLILCGATDGGTIRDSRDCIATFGDVPAACTCGACRRIAEIMHLCALDPHQARRRYRREHAGS